MMRTAILLAVALALTAVAVPVASADPIVKCVYETKFTDTQVCVVAGDGCYTAGGHVGTLVKMMGHCP